MSADKNIDEMDYFDFLLLRDKPATLFIRSGKMFFYVENKRFEIKDDELRTVNPDQEWGEGSGELISVRFKNTDMRVDGFIRVEPCNDRTFVVAFTPKNKKKHDTLVLAVGSLVEEETEGRENAS